MNAKEQIEPARRVVAGLRRFAEVERIYLFGSRAIGDAEARSDIDLAISCPSATSHIWLDICGALENADTLLSIDVVRLEDASPAFGRKILAEGYVLYERQKN